MVLWAHFPLMDGGMLLENFQRSSRLIYAGYLGVDIFFALSGFLITRILLREKSEGRLSFKRFYWKRTVRIFPLYYLVILFVGVIISWENLGWSAAYLSNYYFAIDSAPNALRHTWSLCVEEHFYLIWPLIISSLSLVNAKRVIMYIVPVLAIGSAVVALLTSDFGPALVNKASHIRVLTISLGSLLAFFENHIYMLSRNVINYLSTILVILLVALIATHMIDDVNLIALYRFILSAGASVSLLIWVIVMQHRSQEGFIVTLLCNPVFEFIGKISYGLYLFHLPILYYFGVSHMDGSNTISISTGLGLLMLCLVIPTLSFYLFEKPLLRFKALVS